MKVFRIGNIEIDINFDFTGESRLAYLDDDELVAEYRQAYANGEPELETVYAALYERGIENPLAVQPKERPM